MPWCVPWMLASSLRCLIGFCGGAALEPKNPMILKVNTWGQLYWEISRAMKNWQFEWSSKVVPKKIQSYDWMTWRSEQSGLVFEEYEPPAEGRFVCLPVEQTAYSNIKLSWRFGSSFLDGYRWETPMVLFSMRCSESFIITSGWDYIVWFLGEFKGAGHIVYTWWITSIGSLNFREERSTSQCMCSCGLDFRWVSRVKLRHIGFCLLSLAGVKGFLV